MVSRTPDKQEPIHSIQYFADATYTFTLTQNDTFTLSDFVDTENLKYVKITKVLDAANVTCTYAANNVVTVTNAGTNMVCRVYAFGVLA
jgi:hypothetical protein